MTDTEPTITPFIATLPKAELHVHLVGSASPDTVLALARRHPDADLPSDLPGLRRFFEFDDFAHFIRVYIAVNAVVRTAADVRDLVIGAARDAARSKVTYMEMTVTPASHLLVGITARDLGAALVDGRTAAREEFDVEMNWIFDIASEQGAEIAWQAVRFAVDIHPEGTVGFGLGGPEEGWPRALFAPHFAAAREAGLRAMVHAGETTGPATVRSAIDDLGADRIGHGVSVADDADLIEYVRARGVTLDMCPTSNVRTRAVPDLNDHPLPALLRAGVKITLSTDDPGMFATDLNREYAMTQHTFGLADDELLAIAHNAVDAAFCDEPARARLSATLPTMPATAS